jgi:hypothetical protein
VDGRPLRDRLSKTVGDNIIKFSGVAPGAPGKAAPPIVKPPEEDILVIDDATPTPPSPARQAAPRVQPRSGDDDILIIQ